MRKDIDMGIVNFNSLDGFTNSPAVDVVGTCLQGYIHTSFDRLVDTFGQPTVSDSCDGKTRVEWRLRFSDGTIATIYDWKESVGLESVNQWHIGGTTNQAVENVIRSVV